MVDVSVVIPSLNEAATIGICIEKIKTVFKLYNIDGEIIVADNSDDNTPRIAESLGAKVVTPDKKGYGYAYLYGFKYANGKYIIMGDADDTYDFMEMPKLLEPLMKDEADLVIGSRFKGKIEKGAMPWLHKWVGNPILTSFLNFFFKAGISDAHCGFRAITKEALEKLNLNSDGMEFASEMIIEAIDKGLRIKEVPISYYRRKSGKSKLFSFQDGWRHLKFMLMHTPNYLFIYPGALLLLIGFLWIFSALLNIYIGYFPGVHSMIAGSLLTIVGYQALFFGLFAKAYLGKSLPRFLTLEKGAIAGTLMFIAGAFHVLYMILEWISSGLRSFPSIELDIISFTLIVLGIQTFFSSFMLSIILTVKRKKSTEMKV